MSITVGVDCSARSTGVVILHSDLPGQTLLIQPKKLTEGKRLKYIYDALKEFLEGESIDLAVVETPSFKSTNRPFTLGEVHGVVKLVLENTYADFLGVAPKTLKKYASGKGTASKSEMIDSAGRVGCTSLQNDICDAWLLARLGKDILEDNNSPGTRAAYEVIVSLRKKLL